MRVLFVNSGNNGICPIVGAQAKSLRETGLQLELFSIMGKGFWGYLKSFPRMRKHIKEFSPDIIHAHYSLCGIAASMITKKTVITSLMGSDVKSSGLWRIIVRFFVAFVWRATIVKSEDMNRSLSLKTSNIHVIPNGVDLNLFKPADKTVCRKNVGWNHYNKIVLFAANPKRPEKSYSLAKTAIDILNRSDVELKVVYGVAHESMPLFMNAADALLLTSLWEGSPNIVKEAMACNLPVVSTDVGDVRWLLGGVSNSFVCRHEAEEIASFIATVISDKGRSDGNNKIGLLQLSNPSVAERIISVYAATLR